MILCDITKTFKNGINWGKGMKSKIFKFRVRNLIFAGIVAIFILTLSALSGVWNPFNSLDNNLSDSMFQHKSERAKEIYIVGIDDDTIEKYDAYNPIEYRQYFADILNMWADNDCIPSVIGFDVIFNKAYGLFFANKWNFMIDAKTIDGIPNYSKVYIDILHN